MTLETAARWLRGFTPAPPSMPPLPDFRTLAAPRMTRTIPGFERAWSSALSEIQGRVADWAEGAWTFLVDFNLRAVSEAIRLGLGVGLMIGFGLGVVAGIAIYSRHVTTVANRRAIDK